MNTLRIWLLVLLAVLLPVRGAVAAAMLCPPMGSAGQVQQLLVNHHPAEPATSAGDRHHHDQLQHHHGQAGHHAQQASSSSADKCNLCAAYCSATPMPNSVLTVAMPAQLSTVTFPDLAAPSPSFVSGGQDRPPRTR